jgi:hypothetical protein
MARFVIVPERFTGRINSRHGDAVNSRYMGGTNHLVKDETTHGSYKALLFDERWKKRRLEIIERDNGACRMCGDGNKLQVHHRQYHFIQSIKQFKQPWDYPSNLLITLCESCHSRGHSKFKIPNIKL